MKKTWYIVSPVGEISTPLHEIADFSNVLHRLEKEFNEAHISVLGFDEPIEYEPGVSLHDEQILTIHPVCVTDSKKAGYVPYYKDDQIWCISAPSDEFIECMEFGAGANYRKDCVLNVRELIELVDNLLFGTPTREYFYLEGRRQCDKRLLDWHENKTV